MVYTSGGHVVARKLTLKITSKKTGVGQVSDDTGEVWDRNGGKAHLIVGKMFDCERDTRPFG